MARVTNRKLRHFIFGAAPKKRRKRRGGAMAQRMKNAPKHCKLDLGSCMRGPGGRAKAGKCMRAFHACIR
jgi:hypothetical protein